MRGNAKQRFCCRPCFQREWRRDNPRKVKQYSDKYAQSHRKERRENTRRWREENPERAKAYDKAYYEANKEERIALATSWMKANPSRVRAYRIRGAVPFDFTGEQVEARMQLWGERCWMCGGEYEENEHVKPVSAGGVHAPMNLRPSCHDCNREKWAKWPIDVSGWRRPLLDAARLP